MQQAINNPQTPAESPVIAMECTMAVEIHNSGNPGGRSELAVAAEITQEIQRIDAIAQGLGLAATNALLVAKRASAIGFTVVARELHGFARTLENDLQGLVRQIHTLVHRLAQLMQKQRQMSSLCASCRSSLAARRNIGAACDLTREDLTRLRLQVRELWAGCGSARDRVEKRGRMGIAVGHSAMIEASQGGTQQSALRQIAVEVSEIVDTILLRVRDLENNLSTRGESQRPVKPGSQVSAPRREIKKKYSS